MSNLLAGPRKSISKVTAIFLGDQEQEIIGKEISRPTKSFATRAWAEDQGKLNRNSAYSTYSNRNMKGALSPSDGQNNEQIQAELRHAHMSLLAERARVQELETQLKSIMEEKYTNQSNIIDQLRSSQDKLREQLHLVIRSKMDLCESTALEIERLRIIIAELTNHLTTINGGKAPQINIEQIMSKYNKQIKAASQQNQQERKEDENELKQMLYPPIDNRSLEQQLNNPMAMNPSLPRYLQPFPHKDISRIDIRTVEAGDGVTYPDPFAAVDLKYTGYKYIRDNQQWTKFTSTNISSTVFETRLGNHENIIGLEQAVLSMTKGEVARVWVPSRLGYGVHGAEPLIPPNTDLVFELTLVEIRNDFAMGGDNVDTDPLDPTHIQHIQQDDDINLGSSPHNMNDPQYSTATHSQLTTNNLNTLNSMNNMNQNDQMPYQSNEYAEYDVADDFPQQNTFQVL